MKKRWNIYNFLKHKPQRLLGLMLGLCLSFALNAQRTAFPMTVDGATYTNNSIDIRYYVILESGQKIDFGTKKEANLNLRGKGKATLHIDLSNLKFDPNYKRADNKLKIVIQKHHIQPGKGLNMKSRFPLEIDKDIYKQSIAFEITENASGNIGIQLAVGKRKKNDPPVVAFRFTRSYKIKGFGAEPLSADDIAFQAFLDEHSLDKARRFLIAYPNSPHAKSARQYIRNQEDLIWNEAITDNTIEAFEKYEKIFAEDGRFLNVAEQKKRRIRALARMEKRDNDKPVKKKKPKKPSDTTGDEPDEENPTEPATLTEQEVWDAIDLKDKSALEDFVKQFPNGRYAAEAKEQIARLTDPSVRYEKIDDETFQVEVDAHQPSFDPLSLYKERYNLELDTSNWHTGKSFLVKILEPGQYALKLLDGFGRDILVDFGNLLTATIAEKTEEGLKLVISGGYPPYTINLKNEANKNEEHTFANTSDSVFMIKHDALQSSGLIGKYLLTVGDSRRGFFVTVGDPLDIHPPDMSYLPFILLGVLGLVIGGWWVMRKRLYNPKTVFDS